MKLKDDIKNRNFKRAYLFFGEESFLIEGYEKRMREAVVDDGMSMMNMDVFAGKDASVEAAISSAQTAAFMSGHRLVVLRDTGLFATGRKEDTEKMAAFLPEIPDTTVVLFIDGKVDKRNRLYKKIADGGGAVEFKSLSEKEQIDWLRGLFAKAEKQLSPQSARLLLRTVSGDMQHVYNEAQKLIAYKKERQIDPADIEAVCTKSLETKIFDLVAAVGNKDPKTALDIFNNLLLLKESPIMVLSMIARQFRLILQCKYLGDNGGDQAYIASAIGLRSFMISEYLRQGRNFSMNELMTALEMVLNADVNIKTGRMGDKLAVEVLIFSLVDM